MVSVKTIINIALMAAFIGAFMALDGSETLNWMRGSLTALVFMVVVYGLYYFEARRNNKQH